MLTFNQSIGSNIVIDTGLLIEYLSANQNGIKINEMIFSNKFITTVNISPLTLIEIYYLVRRKSNQDRARQEIDKIRQITSIIPLISCLELIGDIKSVTAFSLADSANIAIAEYLRIPVIFKHEKEIDRALQETEHKNYTERIIFIDDFPFFKSSEK